MVRPRRSAVEAGWQCRKERAAYAPGRFRVCWSERKEEERARERVTEHSLR